MEVLDSDFSPTSGVSNALTGKQLYMIVIC